MTGPHPVRALLVAAGVALAVAGCAPPPAAPFTLTAAPPPTRAATTPASASWLDTATYPAETGGAVRYAAVIDAPAYDGDTLTVIRLTRTGRDSVTADRVTVRLAHIDAPESRGGTPESKAAARAARDRLRVLAPPGAAAVMYDLGPDKYGRTLAQVNVGGVNLGETLLREGHAKPYEGGAKS